MPIVEGRSGGLNRLRVQPPLGAGVMFVFLSIQKEEIRSIRFILKTKQNLDKKEQYTAHAILTPHDRMRSSPLPPTALQHGTAVVVLSCARR